MNAPSKAPEINERVGDGRFELLAKLGEGGMSVVYRAHDHLLQSEVALKLLQPRYVGRPEREQRLINEGRYLQRLQGQPHIVKFIDDGRLNEFGWPWLATEVLEGKTLNWQFIAGTISSDAVLRIAYQVAESLLACHRQGIVNRDPTPSNVFVVNDDPYEIKLFDFSHAAELGGPPLEAGMPGRLTGLFDAPGTVGYMSPEQARKAVPDASMDVFGFGALLYELATKQRPYAEFDNRDLFIQAQRAGQLEPLRMQAWIYGLPEGVGQLVHECTRRDPAQRPTMESIVKRLEQLGVTVPESDEPTQRAPKLNELDGDVTAQFDAEVIAKLRSHKAKDDSTAEDEIHRLDALAHRDPDHTEQMDAAAAIGRARHAAPAADVIGSWTRPPDATPLVNPSRPAAATAAAIVPVLDERDLAPVLPLVREPAPSAELEDRTDMLAFARPPQLREPAALPSVVVGADSADAPEARQRGSGSSAGIDPENSSTESGASVAEEPAPLEHSQGRKVGLLLGLGVIVMILSWVAYSKFGRTEGDPEKKIDGERDQSAAGVHVPDEAAETGEALPDSNADAADSDVEAADSDAVDETSGVEIVPEVEPANGGTPTKKKIRKTKKKPGTPKELATSDPTESPECSGIEDKVQAAQKKRDWGTVLSLAKRSRCWSSKRDRKRLEVSAYLNLARWSECVEAGDGSNDAMIKTFVASCKKNL